jgi:hypothetical protein
VTGLGEDRWRDMVAASRAAAAEDVDALVCILDANAGCWKEFVMALSGFWAGHVKQVLMLLDPQLTAAEAAGLIDANLAAMLQDEASS